jgi:DNA-binding NarL/FixJ family response regulator
MAKYILIVDDSPLIRETLRDLLEGCSDWAVCGEAENGQDGVDQAQRLHPDLIVLDRKMPVMDGLQAARELKRLMPAIPLLMFTNFKTADLETEALTAGIAVVVDKSESFKALISSIRRLFDS